VLFGGLLVSVLGHDNSCFVLEVQNNARGFQSFRAIMSTRRHPTQ